jgi:hypothetical protein
MILIFDDKQYVQIATELDVSNNLKFLSRILNDLFKKRVFILVDEYGTPIIDILQHEQFPKEDRSNF